MKQKKLHNAIRRSCDRLLTKLRNGVQDKARRENIGNDDDLPGNDSRIEQGKDIQPYEHWHEPA